MQVSNLHHSALSYGKMSFRGEKLHRGHCELIVWFYLILTGRDTYGKQMTEIPRVILQEDPLERKKKK